MTAGGHRPQLCLDLRNLGVLRVDWHEERRPSVNAHDREALVARCGARLAFATIGWPGPPTSACSDAPWRVIAPCGRPRSAPRPGARSCPRHFGRRVAFRTVDHSACANSVQLSGRHLVKKGEDRGPSTHRRLESAVAVPVETSATVRKQLKGPRITQLSDARHDRTLRLKVGARRPRRTHSTEL
jgi:hypothetical protein